MSRLRLKLAVGVAVVGAAATTAGAIAGDRAQLRTSLTGYEEVPAISTTGGGQFKAVIDHDSDRILYEVSYADLEGNVLQSHIHFGQKGVNGGISAFLCTNLGNGPAGTPPCAPPPATATGEITPAVVTGGANAQGIEPGAYDELVAALRAGVAYANVHTSKWPAGEIRGQIEARQDD